MNIQDYKKILLGLGLAMALCLASPSWAANGSHEDRTLLALINDDSLTTDLLLAELKRIHTGQQSTNRSHFDLEKIVNKLVNDRLLIQDARLLGMDQEPEMIGQVEDVRRGAAVDQYLQETIPDSFALSEAEIETYYQEQFRQLRLYVLPIRRQSLADSLRATMRKGDHLEALMPQFAQEIYTYGGGDQGFKFWRDLDAGTKEKAASLQVGGIGGPVPYQSVFALFEILDERTADTSHLDAHRARISAILNQQKKREFRQQLITDLRQEFPVAVQDSLLPLALDFGAETTKRLKEQNPSIAQVGAEVISVQTLRRQLRHIVGLDISANSRDMASDFLQNLISDRLLQQAAETRGYGQHPAVLQTLAVFQDSLLLMSYLEQIVYPQVEVAAAEMDSFYQANQESYRAADAVKVAQITVATEDSGKAIIARLHAGADFAWLAREFSLDEYAPRGGERGWLDTGTYPEEMRAKFSQAQPGQILEPFAGDDGFIVMKVTDRRIGQIRDFETVKGLVQQQLTQIKFGQVLDRALLELKKSAKIVIFHEELDRLVIGGSRE